MGPVGLDGYPVGPDRPSGCSVFPEGLAGIPVGLAGSSDCSIGLDGLDGCSGCPVGRAASLPSPVSFRI